jgi:hypothetical protein
MKPAWVRWHRLERRMPTTWHRAHNGRTLCRREIPKDSACMWSETKPTKGMLCGACENRDYRRLRATAGLVPEPEQPSKYDPTLIHPDNPKLRQP